MANGTQFLVFAIDAGNIQWHSAHDTRQEAVDVLNDLRPDGTQGIHDDGDKMFTVNDCVEFAFIVESPHFVSFV